MLSKALWYYERGIKSYIKENNNDKQTKSVFERFGDDNGSDY